MVSEEREHHVTANTCWFDCDGKSFGCLGGIGIGQSPSWGPSSRWLWSSLRVRRWFPRGIWIWIWRIWTSSDAASSRRLCIPPRCRIRVWRSAGMQSRVRVRTSRIWDQHTRIWDLCSLRVIHRGSRIEAGSVRLPDRSNGILPRVNHFAADPSVAEIDREPGFSRGRTRVRQIRQSPRD